MADIFISYKREDRRFAERLSIALEQLGFEVWWDFELLCGDRYRRVIRRVIDECQAAIVVWSTLAVESDFVMDEATHAKEQKKLLPVRIDEVPLPFGFGGVQTEDLTDWNGEPHAPAFQNLVRALEIRIGKPGRLGGGARTVEAEAAAAELEAFKTAQLAENATSLRKYLTDYPEGRFAEFVKGQLETISANALVGAGAGHPGEPGRSPAAMGGGGARGAGNVGSVADHGGRLRLLMLGAIAAVIVIGALGVGIKMKADSDRREQILRLTAIALPLQGLWRLPGQDCSPTSAVRIQVRDGTIVMSEEVQSVVGEDSGSIHTRTNGADYFYRITGRVLTMRSSAVRGDASLEKCGA